MKEHRIRILIDSFCALVTVTLQVIGTAVTQCESRFVKAHLMKAFLLSLVTGVGMQTGCVLPGGLQSVGGQLVEGRLVNRAGQGIPNEQIILLQGHVNRLDHATFRYLDEGQTTRQIDRALLWTDSEGHFSHKFQSFTHCHPCWIIPPLLTLPSELSGETRHGRFFVLKTRDQIYEVTVDKSAPVVRVFDPAQGRARRIEKLKMNEELIVRSGKVPWTYRSGSTGLVEQVKLELIRK